MPSLFNRAKKTETKVGLEDKNCFDYRLRRFLLSSLVSKLWLIIIVFFFFRSFTANEDPIEDIL